MNILLTGASGFVGSRLIARLSRDGHALHALGRRPPDGSQPVKFSRWDADGGQVPAEALDGCEAIIHLAGEPVAQRWNDAAKARIRNSRVRGTRAIVQAIAERSDRPRTLVSASAIGYYGDRGDEILDETSPKGTGFLAEVCEEWEREANAAGNLGVRVVMLRLGVVLGPEGGALQRMLPPFRMGIGGPFGSGRQWMSWIDAGDLIEMIVFSLHQSQVFGPVNATAPNPVRNAEFARALGAALRRPAMVKTPAFALKVVLGEGASAVMSSERVLPRAAEGAGFSFRYPEIHEALRAAVTASKLDTNR